MNSLLRNTVSTFHLKPISASNPSTVSIWVQPGPLGELSAGTSHLANQLYPWEQSGEKGSDSISPHPAPISFSHSHETISLPFAPEVACGLLRCPGPWSDLLSRAFRESRSSHQPHACLCRDPLFWNGVDPGDPLTLPDYRAHQVINLLQWSGCFQGA